MNDFDLALTIIGDLELARRKSIQIIEILSRELEEARADDPPASADE